MPHHARYLQILLVVVCLTCVASAVQAAGFTRVGAPIAWEDIFAGTRSESMGQADLAVSQGPMSIFDTPAPLPEGEAVQAGYGNLAYFAELDFHQYAVAVETGAFRLGLARMDLVSDSMLIRTAYQPDGTGETYRVDDRMLVIAGSMNVAELLAPGSPWDWTVGIAHRNYRFNSPEEVTHVKGLDFGSSGRYRHRWQNTSLIASAAGVLRNIDDSHYVPEDTRLGLGLSLAVDSDSSREAIVLTLAYVFKDVRAEEEYFGDRHYGAELTLLQAVSFRMGRDEQIFGGSTHYGLGLDVPGQWIKPFGVTLDWGAMNTGSLSGIGLTDETSFNMFSVTIRREM